jgi:hypothetical protein
MRYVMYWLGFVDKRLKGGIVFQFLLLLELNLILCMHKGLSKLAGSSICNK